MKLQKINNIQIKLLSWYKVNARDLPWRNLQDPYQIWISEVMLQQTQVQTVIPYFERWLAQFPTIQDVATGSEESILKIWEGLGYYSRARNIKKAADLIVHQYNGKIPQEVSNLIALPGIGLYIAGAIASIAFCLDEPALEANGLRVMSRLFDFHGFVNRAKNKEFLREKMRNLLPTGKAGIFNQAVMDLGALICTSNIPKCEACPIKKDCCAFINNSQMELPKKIKSSPKPHYDVVAAIIIEDEKVLIDKRPSKGLLGGLWEYPGGKVEFGETHIEALMRELTEELGIFVKPIEIFDVYKHSYTHFSVTVYSYLTKIVSGKPKAIEVESIGWVKINELNDYPMGKIDRSISNDLVKRIDL